MIQAILCYRFHLGTGDSGEIEPEFIPIKLQFNSKDFSDSNYSDLIERKDIFGIFYQHTTGIFVSKGAFSNYYIGRLKETPYQVISCFRQEIDRSQFITISIFDLDDEIEIFDDIIKKMSRELEPLFQEHIKIKSSTNLALHEELGEKFENAIKFAIFQVDRLSQLDKLQKVALIFQSEERLKILEILRERPIAKKFLKDTLEKTRPNVNIDLLVQPLLELNLVRRDWIKGERDKKTVETKHQGEYLFLVKDITLSRLPNEDVINTLKNNREDLYIQYEKIIEDYFLNYNPNKQTFEEMKELASVLLIPDCYDFFVLMRKNFYPLKKIPKIFSDFVDADYVLNTLEKLKVITKIRDKNEEDWVILLSDIVPIITFPEYSLPKLVESYLSNNIEQSISYEIARKAIELLEVTYFEKVKF